jgi:hypothetical protein
MACRGLKAIGLDGGMKESVMVLAGACHDCDGLVRTIAMESLRAIALQSAGPLRQPRGHEEAAAALRSAFDEFIGVFGQSNSFRVRQAVKTALQNIRGE